MSLTYNPEEVPTSYTLHINSIVSGSTLFRVISIGESGTYPNDENKFIIEIVVVPYGIEEEKSPYILPLFGVDIEAHGQLIVVSASSETGQTGQGTIKAVEAQNESRPIG
jgi:hypothetical protein